MTSSFNSSFQDKNRNIFLWSFQKEETNSQGYLFGTIHVPYTEVWDRGQFSLLKHP